jgi:hypothetical protein
MFIRSPYQTNNPQLENITSFEKEFEGTNIKTLVIVYPGDDKEAPMTIFFEHSEKEIEQLGKIIFSRDSLTEYHKESIRLVLMCAELFRGNRQKYRPIFVTRNNSLLKNRLKFIKFNPYDFPMPCILTVEETMERMDLFAKFHGKYFTSQPRETLDKGSWYFSSFRSKVPHYQVQLRSAFEPRPILEGFASRFTYLLLCIDELGIDYYFSDDASFMMPYHFNYFLPLLTSIFDSLAIAARDIYSLEFAGKEYPTETSLYGRGKEFREALKKRNRPLGEHIDRYYKFFRIIHKLRELVIHRQGFKNMGVERQNYLVIDKEIAKMIKNCGDKTPRNEQISNWGVIINPIFVLLEPYHFGRMACLKLIEFADEFVKLLGYDRYEHQERIFQESTLDSGRWKIYDR